MALCRSAQPLRTPAPLRPAADPLVVPDRADAMDLPLAELGVTARTVLDLPCRDGFCGPVTDDTAVAANP